MADSPTRNYLKAWSLWCQGRLIPAAMEYQPPALTVIEAEFRAGHMDTPAIYDDGMEALSVSIKLIGVNEDILSMFGFHSGSVARFFAREGYTGGQKIIDEIEGLITGYESDARTESDRAKSAVTITIRPSYYRRTSSGKELVCIIPEQGVRRFGGVDPFQDITDFVMGRSN